MEEERKMRRLMSSMVMHQPVFWINRALWKITTLGGSRQFVREELDERMTDGQDFVYIYITLYEGMIIIRYVYDRNTKRFV